MSSQNREGMAAASEADYRTVYEDQLTHSPFFLFHLRRALGAASGGALALAQNQDYLNVLAEREVLLQQIHRLQLIYADLMRTMMVGFNKSTQDFIDVQEVTRLYHPNAPRVRQTSLSPGGVPLAFTHGRPKTSSLQDAQATAAAARASATASATATTTATTASPWGTSGSSSAAMEAWQNEEFPPSVRYTQPTGWCASENVTAVSMPDFQLPDPKEYPLPSTLRLILYLVTHKLYATLWPRISCVENLALEPFETAVAVLNLQALVEILDTMLMLPHADKEQCAAFISLHIPTCQDFKDRLTKLLTSPAPSSRTPPCPRARREEKLNGGNPEERTRQLTKMHVRRNWYGKKVGVMTTSVSADVEAGLRDRRAAKLYSPIYNGLTAGLSFVFIGSGIQTILMEWTLDGNFMRFVLFAITPLLWCVSLFFALQLIQNVTMCIDPVVHFHENSKYYSGIKPRANKVVDQNLPHITIQMPVYKESLQTVLAPSIESIKKAMQTYARHGSTSTIFINDDGLRLVLSLPARPRRAARLLRKPQHRKVSNMNYGLEFSLKAERHLEVLVVSAGLGNPSTTPTLAELGAGMPSPGLGNGGRRGFGHQLGMPHRMSLVSGFGDTRSYTGSGQYGMQYQNREGDDVGVIGNGWGEGGVGEDLEERALNLAIEEMYEESGRNSVLGGRTANRHGWALAILQHKSDVMQVAHHYFENGISYFTRRINRCISMACANGEDAAFIDPADGKEKIWSETNVSEDFDMALRLLLRGYIIRWATYSKGGFKEGVSLTVGDELIAGINTPTGAVPVVQDCAHALQDLHDGLHVLVLHCDVLKEGEIYINLPTKGGPQVGPVATMRNPAYGTRTLPELKHLTNCIGEDVFLRLLVLTAKQIVWGAGTSTAINSSQSSTQRSSQNPARFPPSLPKRVTRSKTIAIGGRTPTIQTFVRLRGNSLLGALSNKWIALVVLPLRSRTILCDILKTGGNLVILR
ncbi:hypothetical protein B0H16DRAFT_1734293 [Mycena metata]|uniref:Glycosyltransferase 2-like domain-containing protein n=1 Tax=Mycena metata TaxID=1033252 RepID=A0AAD7HWG9_9AGAR|nr:hypothetical protein B0H16DRAFT_1734293 [Mycena metata]